MNVFGTNEQVTVTTAGGLDNDGNPLPDGEPVVIDAFTVAPGNTTGQFTESGGLDSAEFTVYLPLGSPISDDDLIEVRGRTCLARVQEWRDPWSSADALECLEVLCKSTTGAS